MSSVVGTAVISGLRGRARRGFTGEVAGFVLLGAYLSCYRFMYYDALLAFLPLAVLVASRSPLVRWVALGCAISLCGYENYGLHHLFGHYKFPTDTLILLALWLWTGTVLIVRPGSGPGPQLG